MELIVERFNSAKTHTDGLLFVNKKFECFTLEDDILEKLKLKEKQEYLTELIKLS